jgi:uncharacterized Zn-finger protein
LTNGNLNESINSDQPIDVDSQRLPGTLEQIRALADTSINFGTDQPNGSAAATSGTGDSSQAVKRSGGKPKKYNCKQCGEVSTTKEAHWIHNKIHIPIEKQLVCTDCSFVTEYKHHVRS